MTIRERISPAQILGDSEPKRVCGEVITDEEFFEFMRTGVVPPRILKQHTWPKAKDPAPWE